MKASPETAGPSSGMPPVLGTGLSEIVSEITPSLEFTSPAFVLASSMPAPRSTLPASPPPPTTRHPSPLMPVELIIGKVSLGPLGNTSFSGSTGIGTMSLSGLSLTASGKDCPSVLLPLATMVPSCSKVMSALSPSLILKGTPRSLMVMVKLLPCSVSWQFSVCMMIWSIPLTLVPSGSMSMTSPGTSTSLPIAVPPARGPLSTSCGSGSGDALPGGELLGGELLDGGELDGGLLGSTLSGGGGLLGSVVLASHAMPVEVTITSPPVSRTLSPPLSLRGTMSPSRPGSLLTTSNPPSTTFILTLTLSMKSACVPSSSWRTKDARCSKVQSVLGILMVSTTGSGAVLRVSTSVSANGPGCCVSACACADCSPSANTWGCWVSVAAPPAFSSVVSCAPAVRAQTNVNINAATATLMINLLCTPHPLCLLWSTVFYTPEQGLRYLKKTTPRRWHGGYAIWIFAHATSILSLSSKEECYLGPTTKSRCSAEQKQPYRRSEDGKTSSISRMRNDFTAGEARSAGLQ